MDANNVPTAKSLGSDIEHSRIDDEHVARDIEAIEKLDSTIASLSTEVKNGFDKHLWTVLPFLSDHITYCQVALYVSRRIDSLSLINRKELGPASSFPECASDALRMCREEFQDETMGEPAIHAAKALLKLLKGSEALLDHLNRSVRNVAPNLVEVVGPKTAARFIAKAGSLKALAKMPATTLQILGSERVFREARRTGSNTPKHGKIIYSSEVIQLTPGKYRGKIARILANKCALAARCDLFIEHASGAFGRSLRQDVNRKLAQLQEVEKQQETKRLLRELPLLAAE
ncbi:hypothetical protein F5Y01DRAFT_275935 [Xylaria sp. FL0043]|nr:hypothetical protein F5Y01DRAFT_275935 [Xylaria sp. FL0043]